MPLDFSNLTASLAALERAHNICRDQTVWDSLSTDVKEAVTAGVIQSFEVAYEQSWKMMSRWIELNPLAGTLEGSATMRQMFRLAAKSGLIDDVDEWLSFRDARNKTSHTYDGKIIETVVLISYRFLPLAKIALAMMEARND
jgi:nucleotidyltransferase substrate binding protein (TIGR01987 family)